LLTLLEQFGLPESGRIPCIGSFYQNAENLSTALAAEFIRALGVGRRMVSGT
jgi:hypothetical protein